MSNRLLIAGGCAGLVVAVATLFVGLERSPVLLIVSLALGAMLLFAGLLRTRKDAAAPAALRESKATRFPILPIVAWALAALGLAAAVVAAVVAIGDARGHAVGHLVVGLLCFGLFAVLAFAWSPQPGTGIATFREVALFLLAVGAFGSFVESLGGSGYDAANAERRISSLASLHSVGTLFGPIAILAVPIGIATCLVLGVTRVVTRLRAD
jgi:hypothetical protein